MSTVEHVQSIREPIARQAREFASKYENGYAALFLLTPLMALPSVLPGVLGPALQGGYWKLLQMGAFIMALLWLLWLRRGGWNARWIESRQRAEQLRYLPLLAPLTGNRQGNWYLQVAAKLGWEHEPNVEITRVCEVLARLDSGANQLESNSDLCQEYIVYVRSRIRDQIAYHKTTALAEERLVRGMSRAAGGLLVLGLASTSLAWLLSVKSLVLVAGLVPAFSASIFAFVSHRESARIARSSRRAAVQFEALLAGLRFDASLDQLQIAVFRLIAYALNESESWLTLRQTALLRMA